MTRIRKTTVIHAPLDKVYNLVRDPKGWATWYTGLSGPDKLTGEGGVGTVAEYHYLMAGTNFPMTLEITKDERTSEEVRRQQKFTGPLTGTQTETYKAKGKDTEAIFEIEYALPEQALGKQTDKPLLERMNERTTEHTLENLKLLCEAKFAVA